MRTASRRTRTSPPARRGSAEAEEAHDDERGLDVFLTRCRSRSDMSWSLPAALAGPREPTVDVQLPAVLTPDAQAVVSVRALRGLSAASHAARGERERRQPQATGRRHARWRAMALPDTSPSPCRWRTPIERRAPVRRQRPPRRRDHQRLIPAPRARWWSSTTRWAGAPWGGGPGRISNRRRPIVRGTPRDGAPLRWSRTAPRSGW